MQMVMRAIGILSCIMLVTACAQRSAEFALPEGDTDKGQQLFVSYGCISCHTVTDMDLPRPDVEGPVSVRLGGRASKVKTYPELVTSIVNPSHRFAPGYREEEVSAEGRSLMTVYNDVMTVTELIDLVAFLESRYERLERPGYRYLTFGSEK